MRRLRLKAPADVVEDYFRLFVNRRAYTLRCDRPHPESGRHYDLWGRITMRLVAVCE